jgi:hypothetical protein
MSNFERVSHYDDRFEPGQHLPYYSHSRHCDSYAACLASVTRGPRIHPPVMRPQRRRSFGTSSRQSGDRFGVAPQAEQHIAAPGVRIERRGRQKGCALEACERLVESFQPSQCESAVHPGGGKIRLQR